MDFTTTKLISDIKQRGMIPTSQNTFDNDDFLDFLNYEMNYYVVPFLMKLREEFFVNDSDSLIGSKSTFNIPERAMGVKLRDVKILTQEKTNVFSIPRIEPEDEQRFNNSQSISNGFILKNDTVKLFGEYGGGDYLRQEFFRRPNELVLQSDCALVSSVSGSIVTCASMPTTWTTSDTFDIIKGEKHFYSKGDDLTASVVDTSAKKITLDDIPTDERKIPVSGDWICLAGESPIPQIPFDSFGMLMLKTVAAILRSQGDDKGAEKKEMKVTQIEDYLKGMFSDRVEGENRKIVNQHNLAWGSFPHGMNL